MELGLIIVITSAALAAAMTALAAANAKKTNELYRIRMAQRAEKPRLAQGLPVSPDDEKYSPS